MYNLSKEANQMLKILGTKDLIKNEIEEIIENSMNYSSLKTITINYLESEEKTIIKKSDVSLYKVEQIESSLYLRFMDINSKWKSIDIKYIETIKDGRKNILWSYKQLPNTEIKQIIPNKKVSNTNFDSYYIVIVNNQVQSEYKGIGIKGEYIESLYIPNDFTEIAATKKDIKDNTDIGNMNKNNIDINIVNANAKIINNINLLINYIDSLLIIKEHKEVQKLKNEYNQLIRDINKGFIKDSYIRETILYHISNNKKILNAVESGLYDNVQLKMLKVSDIDYKKENNIAILAKKYIQDRYKLNKNEFILLFENYVTEITEDQKGLILNDSLFWFGGTTQKNMQNNNGILCKNIIILGFDFIKENTKLTTEGEKFYILNEKREYIEIEGYKLKNKYNFDLFYHKSVLGNWKITHTPTGIGLDGTLTAHRHNLLNKLDELVNKYGIKNMMKMFDDAIDQEGYAPGKGTKENHTINFIDLNSTHKQLITIEGNKAIIKHLIGSTIWKTNTRDIIKDFKHEDVNTYIKHLKKFGYKEIKDISMYKECNEKTNLDDLTAKDIESLNKIEVDPQVEKWNNKLNSTEKINHQLEVLKRLVLRRKKESPNLEPISCNGYIISKILQEQGFKCQFKRPQYDKCYYDIKNSSNDFISVIFKDIKGNKEYYKINCSIENSIKQEVI